MKVKELIERLRKMDQETTVVIFGSEGAGSTPRDIRVRETFWMDGWEYHLERPDEWPGDEEAWPHPEYSGDQAAIEDVVVVF